MITIEKEEQLYEKVLESKKLRTKELNELGFNSADIKKLIEQGKIVRTERGIYEFIDINGLFNYGKKLNNLGDNAKFDIVFQKCYSYGLNDRNLINRLMISCIDNNDYDELVNYLQDLISLEDDELAKDNNFLLLLISYITKISNSLSRRLEQIKENHKMILIDESDTRHSENERLARNKIRIACFENKITNAMRLLKANHGILKNDLTGLIVYKLLQKIIKLMIQNRENYALMIKKEEFSELREKLTNLNSLSPLEKTLLFLLNKLDEIKRGEWQEKDSFQNTNNVNIAIYDENFYLALKLSKEYSNNKGIIENNVLEILLEKIVSLINAQETKITLEDIKNGIIKNHESIIGIIKKYLKQTNNSDYELLIIGLYDIGLSENDLTFSKMMEELKKLDGKDYVFDVSYYIQNFYYSLLQNDFGKSRIYLGILERYIQDERYRELFKGFKNILNISERLAVLPSKVDDNTTQMNYLEKPNDINKEDPDDIKILKDKIATLSLRNPIIIIKRMNDKRRKKIYDLIKDMDSVVALNLGDNQLVLKYHIKDQVDLKIMLQNARSLFENGKYEDSIRVYEETLSYMKKPKPFIFAYLGTLCFRVGKWKKAINYLTIATEFSLLKEKKEFNFTGLINYMKGIKSSEEEEIKPSFEFELNEFEDDNLSEYKIEDIGNILISILVQNEDMDTVFESFNLTIDQINIIKLIIARYYYSIPEFAKGDEILKRVERTKNKSEVVKKLMNEIVVNKKFYQYREDPVGAVLKRKLETDSK